MSNSNGSQVPKRIFRSLSIPSQSSAPTQSSTTRSILLRNDSIENDLEKLEQQYAKKVIEVIRRERSLTMGRHASLSQSMPLERNIRESVFPIPENELEESSGSIVSAPPACEEHEVRSHSIGGVERRGLDRSVLSFNVRDDTRLRILENERWRTIAPFLQAYNL